MLVEEEEEEEEEEEDERGVGYGGVEPIRRQDTGNFTRNSVNTTNMD